MVGDLPPLRDDGVARGPISSVADTPRPPGWDACPCRGLDMKGFDAVATLWPVAAMAAVECRMLQPVGTLAQEIEWVRIWRRAESGGQQATRQSC